MNQIKSASATQVKPKNLLKFDNFLKFRFAVDREPKPAKSVSDCNDAKGVEIAESRDVARVDDDDVSFTYIGSPDDDSVIKSQLPIDQVANALKLYY